MTPNKDGHGFVSRMRERMDRPVQGDPTEDTLGEWWLKLTVFLCGIAVLIPVVAQSLRIQ